MREARARRRFSIRALAARHLIFIGIHIAVRFRLGLGRIVDYIHH